MLLRAIFRFQMLYLHNKLMLPLVLLQARCGNVVIMFKLIILTNKLVFIALRMFVKQLTNFIVILYPVCVQLSILKFDLTEIWATSTCLVTFQEI